MKFWCFIFNYKPLHLDTLEPTNCEEGDIRLSGDLPNQGRVEICRRSIWGTVCNYNSYTDDDDNIIICRMLGYNWSKLI